MYDAIYPGKPWYDTHGRRIQAHGGVVYYENGVYYWIGEMIKPSSRQFIRSVEE